MGVKETRDSANQGDFKGHCFLPGFREQGPGDINEILGLWHLPRIMYISALPKFSLFILLR